MHSKGNIKVTKIWRRRQGKGSIYNHLLIFTIIHIQLLSKIIYIFNITICCKIFNFLLKNLLLTALWLTVVIWAGCFIGLLHSYLQRFLGITLQYWVYSFLDPMYSFSWTHFLFYHVHPPTILPKTSCRKIFGSYVSERIFIFPLTLNWQFI